MSEYSNKGAAWNPQRVELLIKLWEQGYSASQIAQKLSGEGVRISRNAVIGKKSRMKLPGRLKDLPVVRARLDSRAANAIGAHKRYRKPPQKVFPPDPIPTAANPLACQEVSLMGLNENTCRSVLDKIDARGLALYCGNQVAEGKSFCPYHQARYFQPYVRPAQRQNYRPQLPTRNRPPAPAVN